VLLIGLLNSRGVCVAFIQCSPIDEVGIAVTGG